MKKSVLIPTTLAIICAMIFVANVRALDPFGDGIHTITSFHSPEPVGTYLETSIDISMDYYLQKILHRLILFPIAYWRFNATGFISKIADYPYSSNYLDYSISGKLTNLTNAEHKLWVYAYFSNGTEKIIHNGQPFRVNTNFEEPQLIVYSPQNQITYTDAVPIVFNTNSNVLMSYYSFGSSSSDNWIPFTGNTTLTGLSEGHHTLTIFVVTEANRQSTQADCRQTIDFDYSSSQNGGLMSMISNQANMILVTVILATIVIVAALML